MTVKVHIPLYLQKQTEYKEVVDVEGSTIAQCLKNLTEQFPDMRKKLFDESSKLHDYISIYIDGDFAYGDELDRPVKDGEEFNIFYIFSGG